MKATVQSLCVLGEGFLVSDESAGPWLRVGDAAATTIPDTMENRAAHRADYPRHHRESYLVPGLSENISGVILHKGGQGIQQEGNVGNGDRPTRPPSVKLVRRTKKNTQLSGGSQAHFFKNKFCFFCVEI